MSALPRITGLIVEDEPLARRRLRELMRDVAWMHCLGDATDGRAAIEAIDRHRPDLVFLDVQLPGCSGIEVLSRVRHAPAVIFTTAYDQFAVAAFELGALDYLLKPFGRDRFGRAMDRARPMIERRIGGATSARAREVLAQGPVARLFVREAGRIVPIRAGAVERLEACDDFVIVHAGGRRFTINLPLSDLERRLDPRMFVRVHRSRVVNLDYVASWTRYDGSRFQIALRSGTTILASRQRSRELRDLGR
ncbi:MAG: LytR/AlgR family response regulator transcription factor [Candidatus Polarisedimenticolia bacterium]